MSSESAEPQRPQPGEAGKSDRPDAEAGRSDRPHADERIRGPITVEDLQRWEEHGAQWRAVEISDRRAVVELCTCYGEPVDMLQSEAPELIEFVRAHAAR